MCQAYEGERDYILAHEKFMREKGHEAQKKGVPRSDAVDLYGEDREHWLIGWDIAARNGNLW